MYKAHLFICTNAPNKEGKCGHKNSDQLLQQTKAKCKDLGIQDVRVNKSGCLGQCEKGIAAVLYPTGKWFENLSDKDSSVLVSELEKYK